MLSTEREEFDKQLGVLFGGVDLPLTESKRDAFWRGLQRMSMLDFTRTIDHMLESLEDADYRNRITRNLNPGLVWDARKNLRSRVNAAIADQTGNNQHHARSPWHGDSWDERANRWLYVHIANQAVLHGIHYATEQDRAFYPRLAEWQPEPATRQMTAILVGYKNAWAEDVRQDAAAAGEPLDIELQRSTFADCMRRADAEIGEFRKQLQAA